MNITAQDLQDSLSAVYKTLDGRPVKSLQPHEVLVTLTGANFDRLIDRISTEIDALMDVPHESNHARWMSARGYPALPRSWEGTDEDQRTSLFYTALHDLMCERLMKKQQLVSDVALPVAEGADTSSEFTAVEKDIAGVCTAEGDGFHLLEKIAKRDSLPPLADASRYICRWSPSLSQQLPMLHALVATLNAQYEERRRALLKRFDVTVESFLWSEKSRAHDNKAIFADAVHRCYQLKTELSKAGHYLWDVFTTLPAILSQETEKISAREEELKNALKAITIGNVPHRGGVPEGYALLGRGSDEPSGRGGGKDETRQRRRWAEQPRGQQRGDKRRGQKKRQKERLHEEGVYEPYHPYNHNTPSISGSGGGRGRPARSSGFGGRQQDRPASASWVSR